jgi:hypothetical protein
MQVTTRAYVMPNLPADIVLGIHYMRQRGWKDNLEGGRLMFIQGSGTAIILCILNKNRA